MSDQHTPTADYVDDWIVEWWPLDRLLAEVRPGSHDWTWADELADLRTHAWFQTLSDDLSLNPQRNPVLIGTDGRLWDGHHRVCSAMYLGLERVLVEHAPTGSSGGTR